jgi:hypothetical protein
MRGGNEAYEEFVVRDNGAGGCDATLTLWVTLPDGLSAAALDGAVAASLAQIDKEVTLMKHVLEGRSEGTSVH